MTNDGQEARAPLGSLLVYFLKLGTFGFGGPIALAGYMQRDLVDKRHWFSQEEFLEGLALAQLSPGPLAAQLAMYLGLLAARYLGAILVAFAFILPSFVMVIALAVAYVHFGGLSWMQSAFYGIGAGVIAIISRSAIRLVQTAVRRDVLLWCIFIALFVSTALTEREIIWLFVACGIITLILKSGWPNRIFLVRDWLDYLRNDGGNERHEILFAAVRTRSAWITEAVAQVAMRLPVRRKANSNCRYSRNSSLDWSH